MIRKEESLKRAARLFVRPKSKEETPQKGCNTTRVMLRHQLEMRIRLNYVGGDGHPHTSMRMPNQCTYQSTV